jgi:hypothetical protein
MAEMTNGDRTNLERLARKRGPRSAGHWLPSGSRRCGLMSRTNFRRSMSTTTMYGLTSPATRRARFLRRMLGWPSAASNGVPEPLRWDPIVPDADFRALRALLCQESGSNIGERPGASTCFPT